MSPRRSVPVMTAPETPTARSQPPRCDRLWSCKDVADFLGVPVGTLYSWRITQDGPPAFKLGKHLRYDPEAVRAWLRQKAA